MSLERGESSTYSRGLLDITKKLIEQILGIMDDIASLWRKMCDIF